jgi:septum site-determining protein MinD
MSRSILIASGKGGVGKSLLTANIGAALARMGHSVVIIDTDTGLRSQDALLGLENSVVYDLIDAATNECTIEQALLECPAVPRLKLLPASQFARVRALESGSLRKILTALKENHDFILLDAPAGIEKGLRTLIKAGADESVLITTPDDLCVRDVERTSQILMAKSFPRPYLIVNRLDNDLIHRKEMMSARMIADAIDLPLIGEVPEDPAVYRSVLRRSLFIDYDCPARGAVLRIAGRLLDNQIPFPEIGSRKIPLRRRLFHHDLKEVTPLDCH